MAKFSVGDKVTNPSDKNTPKRVFVVKEVLSGKKYKVQRENTKDALVQYEEHELEKKK